MRAESNFARKSNFPNEELFYTSCIRICIIEYAEHESDVRLRIRNTLIIEIWILTIFASMDMQLPSSAPKFLGPGERYGDDFCTEFFAAVLATGKFMTRTESTMKK